MSDINEVVLGSEDKNRLKTYMNAALSQLQEMEDIRESLKDLTKQVAEELNIKPAVLMEAAKVKLKNKRDEKRAASDAVENILEIVG